MVCTCIFASPLEAEPSKAYFREYVKSSVIRLRLFTEYLRFLIVALTISKLCNSPLGENIMRTAIMGTGGLGGYFGAKLAHAGKDVTFIVRGEALQAMRANGIQVHSPHGDFAVASVQATDNPGDVGPVDQVLFCVKSYDLDNAIEAVRPLIGPETILIPVLNGVGHIDRLQDALGKEHVLGGLTMVNAHKGEPGTFHHVADAGQYQLEFGEWDGPISARCQQVQQLWEQADVHAVAIDNIVERMWWKLGAICGGGVFAAARGDKDTVWMPEIEALIRQVVAEVVAVAHAQQIPVTESLPDDLVKIAGTLPGTYKPSLLVDLENGRRVEAQAIYGFVSQIGKELKVPTPANDFIYAVLKPHMNGAK